MPVPEPLPPAPPAPEPLVLPPPPDALPADTYFQRHRAWWERCDVLLRQDCQARKAALVEMIAPNIAPTLTRIADAWEALDGRLGDLAGALESQPGQGADIGAVLKFALDFARITLHQPEAPAGGG